MSSKLTNSTENASVTLSSFVTENAFSFLRALPPNSTCLSHAHQELRLAIMLSLAARSGEALTHTICFAEPWISLVIFYNNCQRQT